MFELLKHKLLIAIDETYMKSSIDSLTSRHLSILLKKYCLFVTNLLTSSFMTNLKHDEAQFSKLWGGVGVPYGPVSKLAIW